MYITDRMMCRSGQHRTRVGTTQEFDEANYFLTLTGNAVVFQSPECPVFSAEICFVALYNYFAICTMPVQLLHREFRFSHKHINCSGKPFSQINTVSVAPLTDLNAIKQNLVISQLFINSVIKGSVTSSIFMTVALFDISVDNE